MKPRKSYAFAVQVLVLLAVSWSTANASMFSLEAPPNAKAPSASGKSFSAPTRDALSGPLANPGIGKVLMQAEADPPATTRGGGSEGLEHLFAARCRSVVLIVSAEKKGNEYVPKSTGTGSIVSMDGYILTAAHIVADSDFVAVGVFPSCKPGAQPESFPAKIIRVDPVRDLALLQFMDLPSDISIMPIGKLDEVRTGSAIVIIGHPRGLYMSLSQGSVSAIRPDYKWLKSQATVIQTDGALNPGNSGGPMMSAEGNLIGVNSFIFGEASAGLNFAISVTEVRDFLAGRNSPSASAPVPTPKASTNTASCKPKELKEWHEDNVTKILFDMDCKGKGDGLFVQPDDKNQPAWFGIDRNLDNSIDVKITLNAEGEPISSLWDDDFDGTYDFRGEHTGGSWALTKKVRL